MVFTKDPEQVVIGTEMTTRTLTNHRPSHIHVPSQRTGRVIIIHLGKAVGDHLCITRYVIYLELKFV